MTPEHPSGGAFTFAVFARFCLDHAAGYYRRADGSQTREHLNVRASLDHLARVADFSAPASTLTRDHLRDLQRCLVQRGLSRTYINATLGRLHRCVGWAVALDLLHPNVRAEFDAVPTLRRGRSPAAEYGPVQPVDEAVFRATLPHLTPRARAVCELLELTGARVGEICVLRNADLDDGDPECWWGIPPRHKAMHHGHRRVIPFDARCQRILQPWRRPLLPEQPIIDIEPNGVYQAIQRACRQKGLPEWSPHQVRHLVATTVRQRLGLDAAQHLLGHADPRMTTHYAPLMPEGAARAQRALGAAAPEGAQGPALRLVGGAA